MGLPWGGLPSPQPIPAPMGPCPAGFPALQRALVTRDSALPLPPLQRQQEVTCDPAAGDAVLGTTMRNENAKTLKKAEGSWNLKGQSKRTLHHIALIPAPRALPHAAIPMSCPGSGRDTQIFLFKRITNYCLIH